DRRFAARDRATQELRKLGGAAGPALREARELKPSKEMSQRIQLLLDEFARPASAGDELRLVRAVELLERLNTPAARQLLEQLAGGAAGARLTEEATAARERLAVRPASNE